MPQKKPANWDISRRKVLQTGAALSGGLFAASEPGAAEVVSPSADSQTADSLSETSEQEITCGQTITGELTEDDPPRGSPYVGVQDSYQLRISEDTVATIELKVQPPENPDEEYNPILFLEFQTDDSSGTLADYHEGWLDERLDKQIGPIRVLSSGTYTIRVTNVSLGMEYDLSVECYEPEGTLECGETISCALGPDGGGGQDARGFRGPEFFYDVFGFTGSQGQRVNISMETPNPEDGAAGDPYLSLLGPTGGIIEEDDDNGFGYSALISTTLPVDEELPADGEYTVIATSWAPSQQFGYDISLVCPELAPDPVECGQTLSGALTQDDPSGFRGPGFHQDAYSFQGNAGDYVSLFMTTPEFEYGDPYLYLLGSNGRIIAMDDDSGPGTGGAFTHRLPADGEYTIVATSRTPQSFFPYELGLNCETGFEGSLTCEGTLGCYGGQDSTASGELGPGDDTGFRGSNYYHDVYCFEGTDWDLNYAEISGEDLVDPRVYIVGPTGEVLAEGDRWAETDDPLPSGETGKIVVTDRTEKGPIKYDLKYRCFGIE